MATRAEAGNSEFERGDGMNNFSLQEVFQKAKAQGRICQRCGWMITKANWKAGERELCAGCRDGLKGVNVPPRWGKWLDEPVDKTGEML